MFTDLFPKGKGFYLTIQTDEAATDLQEFHIIQSFFNGAGFAFDRWIGLSPLGTPRLAKGNTFIFVCRIDFFIDVIGVFLDECIVMVLLAVILSSR